MVRRRWCSGSLRDADTVSITAFQAPLAQLAEQQTLNLRVRGSSPWRRTHPGLALCRRSDFGDEGQRIVSPPGAGHPGQRRHAGSKAILPRGAGRLGPER